MCALRWNLESWGLGANELPGRYLSLLLAAGLLAGMTLPAGAAETTRVSVTSAGVPGNGVSAEADMAGGGRYTAFASEATNLIAGDTNGNVDVFVHDRESGETIRASVSSTGVQANGDSVEPDMSDDGRYTVFLSFASNLVPNDLNGEGDVFLYDLETRETSLVSQSSAGVPGNDFSCNPAISADGTVAAFFSDSTNLVTGDTNGARDIFVRDLTTGTTTRVSVSSQGMQANAGSGMPAVSSDGRYVVFHSDASNLVSGDFNGERDVFIHDRDTGETSLVSVSSNGVQANDENEDPAISHDGRFVAFESRAENLAAGDSNGVRDILLRDLQAGTTSLVSVSTTGAQADGSSFGPSISADGTLITFHSNGANLISGDNNGVRDVFLRNRTEGTTTRVSVASAGTEGNDQSRASSISADGRYVAFESDATNLISADTNAARDVFVRDRQTVAASPLVAAMLPASRSVQVGNAATAFATLINAGLTTATSCSIDLLDPALGTFTYQTTDPATNALTGTPDTPVDIAAGSSQSYVISLAPTAPLAAVDVQFRFTCTNTTPAPVTTGLNTLLLSASNTAGPDVVALAATASENGIVAVPGPSGANAFSVATVNVGVGASITASADTGSTTLPLSLFICNTDLESNCINPPAPEVTIFVGANDTPTFSVFVNANGAIPLDAASNRVIVNYRDGEQNTVGATSVAVTTQ